jgi:pentatricopeptide repeat protein
MKAGNPQRAIEIFQRMKSDGCQPSTDTYTLLINLHGKVSSVVFGSELFCKSDLLEMHMGELAFMRVRCVWESWPS